MNQNNFYNVTQWPTGNPYEDIGQVINSIIENIKTTQADRNRGMQGKPGAVIYIPPGDYQLSTQVVIDISFLKIEGSGHGFTSSSIRFNTMEDELDDWHEVWPGGSRIMVNLEKPDDNVCTPAFLVQRDGNPRISSVEFSNFCIDGLHFTEDEYSTGDPENSYVNGKIGIQVASANDSFVINNMGLVYLEHGLLIENADAMTIDNSFIAECGNCIELRGHGQASKITNNLIGAGYRGYSIYAENYGGILVNGNNVFPRGASSVHFSGVARSSITGNRFHSFYPGMLIFSDNCRENLISANHFLRDNEPWGPMKRYDNGLDDRFGLLNISGSRNSIIANHISESIDARKVTPLGIKPTIIRVSAGFGNYIANNHVVPTRSEVTDQEGAASACFTTQVSALLPKDTLQPLEAMYVVIDPNSAENTVMDMATLQQVDLDFARNRFRALPAIGSVTEGY